MSHSAAGLLLSCSAFLCFMQYFNDVLECCKYADVYNTISTDIPSNDYSCLCYALHNLCCLIANFLNVTFHACSF